MRHAEPSGDNSASRPRHTSRRLVNARVPLPHVWGEDGSDAAQTEWGEGWSKDIGKSRRAASKRRVAATQRGKTTIFKRCYPRDCYQAHGCRRRVVVR